MKPVLLALTFLSEEHRAQMAEVSKAEGEAAQKHADAGLKGAKTQEVAVNTQSAARGEPDDGGVQAKMAEAEVKAAQAEHDAALKERQFERDTQLKFMEFGLRREEMSMNQQIKAADMQMKREQNRADNARMAAQSAQRQPIQGVPR